MGGYIAIYIKSVVLQVDGAMAVDHRNAHYVLEPENFQCTCDVSVGMGIVCAHTMLAMRCKSVELTPTLIHRRYADCIDNSIFSVFGVKSVTLALMIIHKF